MLRVQAEAAKLRVSGVIEARRGDPQDVHDRALSAAMDLHSTVALQIGIAQRLNARRSNLPKRFGPLSGLLGWPMRFILRVYNYVFKEQRELNNSQTLALEYLSKMALETADYTLRLSERLRALERYRTETFLELRAMLRDLDERILGLAHAHHGTREIANSALAATSRLPSTDQMHAIAAHAEFAHERINSAEPALGAVSDRLELTAQELTSVRARVDGLDRTVGALGARSALTPIDSEVQLRIVDSVREVERRIAAVQDRSLRSEALLRAEMIGLTHEVGDRTAENPARLEVPLTDPVYTAIEDRFRGSSAHVHELLGEHLHRVSANGTVTAESPLFDFGCGRGEWLELLKAEGVHAFGVDENLVAVGDALARGVDARSGDALDVLRQMKSASLGALTAFHVAEHLPFGALVEIAREALRVLIPGGIAIFETPNPRNLLVATDRFWLDPTHRRPIPSDLFAFVMEACGFTAIEIRELHAPEIPEFRSDSPLAPLNQYFSAPQDYAVLANRPR